MDRDEYEEYLVDKAKELLEESADVAKDDNRKKQRVAKTEVENAATDVDDAERNMEQVRNEADFLGSRRSKMDNDELEEFLSGESEFHELMKTSERPSFSDWENRVLITSQGKDVETLADELDRSVDEIKLQLKVLGLDR